jgi:hypothetical protein
MADTEQSPETSPVPSPEPPPKSPETLQLVEMEPIKPKVAAADGTSGIADTNGGGDHPNETTKTAEIDLARFM